MSIVVVASPQPILQFFGDDGTFLVGGQLYTTVGGVPYPTYADSQGLIQHANPIVLNSRGEIATSSGQSAQLFLVPNVTYTFALFDRLGNPIDTPTDIQGILTLPAILATLTQELIGSILIPQTDAELAAGITPVNYQYPPLCIDRYGNNDFPGSVSMTVAMQSAIYVARQSGGDITLGVGPYLFDGELDLTTPVGGQWCTYRIIGMGRSKAPTDSIGQNATPSIILKHSGNAFDTTGSLGVHFENLSICSDRVTYPATCFLLARNADGNSRNDRIINCYIFGSFSKTVLYNYGAEDGLYLGNQFYNIATDANSSTFDITANNIRGVTSSFTSIATGQRSTLDHKIIGGEYAQFAGGLTNDVFRLEAARSVKIQSPWLDVSGATSGRSLIYVDGTNGPTQLVLLTGIDGESSNTPAAYGILFSADPQAHVNWTVIGNTFPNVQSMLGGGTGAVLSQLTWFNNSNQCQGGGIAFSGTPILWQTDNTPGGVTTTPASYNETFGVNQGIRVQGEPNFGYCDTRQAAGSKIIKTRIVDGVFVGSKCDDNGNTVTNNFSLGPLGSAFAGSALVPKPIVTGSKGGNVALGNLMTALAVIGLVTDSTT